MHKYVINKVDKLVVNTRGQLWLVFLFSIYSTSWTEFFKWLSSVLLHNYLLLCVIVVYVTIFYLCHDILVVLLSILSKTLTLVLAKRISNWTRVNIQLLHSVILVVFTSHICLSFLCTQTLIHTHIKLILVHI